MTESETRPTVPLERDDLQSEDGGESPSPLKADRIEDGQADNDSAQSLGLLQVGDVIVCKKSQRQFRLVHRGPRHTWLMPLQGYAQSWPSDVLTSKLEKEIGVAYDLVEGEVIATASPKAEAHGAVVYKRYAMALGDPHKLMSSRGRAELLVMLQKQDSKVHRKQFYKIVRRWLVGGMIPAALSADWKGGKPSLTTAGVEEMSYSTALKDVRRQSEKLQQEEFAAASDVDHTVRGTPRKRAVPLAKTKFEINKSALCVFYKYVKARVGTKGSKLHKIYRDMRKEVFSTRSPTNQVVEWPDHACPTFKQFEFWYYRLTTFRTRFIAKNGEAAWNLQGRATLLQGVSPSYAAGAVGSIDATVWPVTIVTDDDSARDVGPPVVFRARCRDHGVLLGLAVSLESASWLSAASAIDNCIQDKPSFCAELGISILPERWPINGLPPMFEADCGETHNSKPEAFIALTGVDLRNLQSGRGDLKPGVEGDWNVLQVALNDLTPGAIIKKYEAEKKEPWPIRGAMTLKAFTAMLVLEELKKMETTRPHLNVPPYFTEAGVATSPLSMWNYSVAHRGGGLRSFNRGQVRQSLLVRDRGSITDSGLRFEDLLYVADELAVTHAYEQARADGRKSVVVAYDSRSADTVYIVVGDPNRPTRYIPCFLNTAREDQKDLAGRTFREIKMIRRAQEVNNKVADANSRASIAGWTEQQEQIKADQMKRVTTIRRASDDTENSQRVGRGAARASEKDATAPSQALTPALPRPVVAPTAIAPSLSPSSGPAPQPTVPTKLLMPRSRLAERLASKI